MIRIYTTILLLHLCTFASAETNSAPSDLILVNITQDPIHLKFDSKSEIPIGTNIHGFVVIGFTPKSQKMQMSPGKEMMVDVSEITLKRGDRTITIRRGEPTPILEPVAHFIDKSENKQYSMRTGDEVTGRTRKLRLLDVNVDESSCTLEDVNAGKQFTIKRMEQPTVPR